MKVDQTEPMAAAEPEPNTEPEPEVEPVAEVSQEDKDQAMALKNQGNSLFKKGKLRQALAKYAAAAELWPTNGIFFTNRAAVFARQKNFEKSEAEARRAVEVDPGFRKGHTRLASALEWQGRLDEAATVLADALAVLADPDDKAVIEKQLCQVEDKIEARESGTTGGEDTKTTTTTTKAKTKATTTTKAKTSATSATGSATIGGLDGLMAGLSAMGGNAPPGGVGGLGGMLAGRMQNPAVMQSVMDSPMLTNLRQSDPRLFDESGAPRADAINMIMADPALMSRMMDMAAPLLASMFGPQQ